MTDDNNLRFIQNPQLRPVVISRDLVARCESGLENCGGCNPEAGIPFNYVIQYIADDTELLDYLLPAPAKCPQCGGDIHVTTLVQPVGNPDVANWI